jgi:hypothetical protein
MITSFFLCYFYYFGLYGVTSWRQIIWYTILEYCKEYNFCQQPFNQIFYCKSHTHFVMGCRLIHKVDEPPKPKELCYGTRVGTDFTQEERDNMTAYSTKPSEPSWLSASIESTSIVSVERCFHDVADLPYQPLPEHSLVQSPCYPIIGRNNNNRLYFCRLHPEVKSVYLESIEHHFKYKTLSSS